MLNVIHTYLPCNLKQDYKYKFKNIKSCEIEIYFCIISWISVWIRAFIWSNTWIRTHLPTSVKYEFMESSVNYCLRLWVFIIKVQSDVNICFTKIGGKLIGQQWEEQVSTSNCLVCVCWIICSLYLSDQWLNCLIHDAHLYCTLCHDLCSSFVVIELM